MPATLGDEARRELVHRGWRETHRLLLVHPGAGGRAKRWPATGFAAVLERVAALARLAIVIHQGPADAEAVAGLPEPLIARAIVLREPPLPLLAGVLSRVAAYIGNDSGISHLAAALGVRGVVLFGAGQLAWRPWAEHVEPLVVSLTAPEESDAARVTAELASLLA
jgi:ADP-heptose:LPS heptosyltransferase